VIDPTAEKQPFANELAPLMRRACPDIDGLPLKPLLIKEVHEAVLRLKNIEGPKNWNSFAHVPVILEGAQNPVDMAVYILHYSQLPSMYDWNQEDKRYLLDRAIGKQIVWFCSLEEQYEQAAAYFNSAPFTSLPEIKSQIQEKKAIQHALRQRVSPSHGISKK
jgi:hypothetical protein